MPTPHIGAAPGEIAKTVLVCGDPKRARQMARTFLENPVLINEIRGMEGYSGTYKNTPVSILSVGMGMPSMTIYAHELFDHYGVDTIIRVGTCGALNDSLDIKDYVLALLASTDSGMQNMFDFPGVFSMGADFDLSLSALEAARTRGIGLKPASILSSDHFYLDDPDFYEPWKKMQVAAVEMEAAALYLQAARASKKALTLLMVTDHLEKDIHMPAAQRQNMEELFELALDTAIGSNRTNP